MKPIIFNAIDKIYNEKTGMVVPVSAAVGEPKPEPYISIGDGTLTENSDHTYNLTLEVTVENVNDWEGKLYNVDPETGDPTGDAIGTFTADNIVEGVLYKENLEWVDIMNHHDIFVQILKNDEELYGSPKRCEIVPYVPAAKFTIDNVILSGPMSGGPFSNVYDVNFTIDFIEEAPEGWTQGVWNTQNGNYCIMTCGGVCYADETGVVKDTGEYELNDGCMVSTHIDGYMQMGSPTYPYSQDLGPATLTIYVDGEVWGEASTDNVTVQTNDNL